MPQRAVAEAVCTQSRSTMFIGANVFQGRVRLMFETGTSHSNIVCVLCFSNRFFPVHFDVALTAASRSSVVALLLAARSSIHSRQTDAVRISLDRTAFSFPLVVAVAAPKFSFASHMHLREIQSLPFDSKLRVIVFCFILPSAHYARGCYHSVQRC